MPSPDDKDDERAPGRRVIDGVVGAAMGLQDAVADGLAGALDLGRQVLDIASEVTAPVRAPLDALGVTDLVRKPVDAVTDRVAGTLARLEERGHETIASGSLVTSDVVSQTVDVVIGHLARSPELDALIQAKVNGLLPALASHPALSALVRAQVEQVLPDLLRHPAVTGLVRAQSDAYLDYLRLHPELLQAVVREQGDRYIEHLNQNPDPVQNLVQAHSAGLAAEVLDEVRERTVTADSVFEIVARRMFGKPPRESLPPPPVEVARRAEVHRLPSDLAPPGDDNEDDPC